jgi:hypothetical protein
MKMVGFRAILIHFPSTWCHQLHKYQLTTHILTRRQRSDQEYKLGRRTGRAVSSENEGIWTNDR